MGHHPELPQDTAFPSDSHQEKLLVGQFSHGSVGKLSEVFSFCCRIALCVLDLQELKSLTFILMLCSLNFKDYSF